MHNGILYSHPENGNHGICHKMCITGNHYVRQSKPNTEKKNRVGFLSHAEYKFKAACVFQDEDEKTSFFFFEIGSLYLYSPGCHGTSCIDQVSLELIEKLFLLNIRNAGIKGVCCHTLQGRKIS